MSSNQTPNRLRRAKSEVTHSRSSVGSLRSEFRNKFFNRLRSSRSRSVDRFRQIVEDYGDDIHYKSIHDVRRALSLDSEAANLMKNDEVNDLLNQIEKELAQVFLQNEGEEYIRENQLETEDIVNRHLNLCQVCNKLNLEGNICEKCSAMLRSEFD
ncbi:hypothetical protein NQ314_020669 [Rhamnusium bicolor]|uniref:Uncharacterized protein n=1 Tax=Rhamnusium bicolor TaxID=1586634 RepID=A0AAV8WK36_9CUCU|nr:hypothetical protein NQ314_020669 [Rhamnusium bicolor]